jgi:hypothetical protein
METVIEYEVNQLRVTRDNWGNRPVARLAPLHLGWGGAADRWSAGWGVGLKVQSLSQNSG